MVGWPTHIPYNKVITNSLGIEFYPKFAWYPIYCEDTQRKVWWKKIYYTIENNGYIKYPYGPNHIGSGPKLKETYYENALFEMMK